VNLVKFRVCFIIIIVSNVRISVDDFFAAYSCRCLQNLVALN
jgi:hypothetical protein